MAVNSVSTAQAVNLLESRGNRAEQRSQDARQAQRAEQGQRSEKNADALRNRVEQNTSAARTRAQANADAATQQRREVQASDKRAELERRQAEKSIIGSRINTTA